MKKFLLSCTLALGFCGSAQTVIFEDSFETYTDFTTSNFGGWVQTDLDGGTTWALEDVVFPNQGYIGAGIIFNNTLATGTAVSTSMNARTGQKGLYYFASGASSTAYPNNDWTISPKISLTGLSGTNKLELYAKGLQAYGPDQFNIAVSTTDTNVTSFTKLNSDPIVPPSASWTKYEFDLSAYAGKEIYIAINCVTNDGLYLMIDDFKVINTPPATVAPDCATLTSPTNNNTTVAPGSVTLSWTAPTTGGAPSSYDVYFGTSANPTTLLGNVTTTSITATTVALTTYYWKVVPRNIVGSATGCSEFSFTPRVLNVPGCATNVTPVNGSTVNIGTVSLSWSAPTTGGTATSYDIYWGTSASALAKLGNVTSPGANITNVNVVGNYYFQIVPINADGPATGCAVNSITAINPFAPYCGPLAYSGVEPISYVNMKYNTANTSSASTAGAIAHEAFITKEFKVEQGTSTEISVNSNTGGNYTHFYSVFIDWNNDGDFADAGESFYTVSGNLFNNKNSTGSGTAGIKTKTLAVPPTATLGKKRMRVKAFYAADAPNAAAIANIANACTNPASAFGQAEDYTIEVVAAGTLAVSDINRADNISVYPNPFTDVLKISDVKGVKSVSVNDISGREVKSLAPSAELNLSSLKAGLYIVNLKMEDGSVKTFKAIKK